MLYIKMNIGKIYIRPLNLITYRTFNSEYYSKLRKKMVENYNNKKKRVFVQKEPKKIVTNYGSFQNFDKTKWSPVDIVVEMKSLKMDNSYKENDANDADDEWVDVKKIL
jgi:hypothetical protein